MSDLLPCDDPCEPRRPRPSRRRFFWVLLAVVCVLAATDPARAQDDDEYVPEDDELEAFDDAEDAEDAVDFGSVDDLLAMDEEILSDPGVYSYDPGARRDPFRSLLRRRQQDDRVEKRPDGPAGLLIDELEVQGIFVLDDGPVAQVQSSSQQTSFLLRPGDELWDGDVVRITLDEIVFKQSVNDPTALKPFREVVKRLNPGK